MSFGNSLTMPNALCFVHLMFESEMSPTGSCVEVRTPDVDTVLGGSGNVTRLA
jgi:hypothetical protein